MRFSDVVTESFDKPYPYEWNKDDFGDYHALAFLDDGSPLELSFGHEGGDLWHVTFDRNFKFDVTGEGDQQRVFATVLAGVKDFVQKRQPQKIIFSATKSVKPGQKITSRAGLYNSLVNRYAAALGYTAQIDDRDDQVFYELTRISKQPVAEGSRESKVAAMEKKLQDMQNRLELTRERRKMRGQRIQSTAEINLAAKMSELRQQIHQLKSNVTESASMSTHGTTSGGYTWRFEAGREVPWKTDVAANTFIRVTDPRGKTVAGVWADVAGDSLVVEYSQVFDEKLRGRGLYTDLLKSLSDHYDITSDTDTNNAAVGIYRRLGADYDAGQARHTLRKKGVAEGKLVESAVFLNSTTVVVGQAHGQPLELSPNTLKQIQAIAAKHGAWYEGNGTDRGYTKGQIDRYVGSWDDEVAKTANSNDPKWLYVLFANVDENNRVQRVGVDPRDTIFNRLLATAKDNSFQGIGYTSQALQKFLQMASEGKYDFLKMSQQPATQENLTRFLKAGEALMWPSNWEQYPNKAGKIAKAATVDVRDQYLATRKAGVYVTGSGHLKAVQNITGKQGVAEGAEQKYLWHGSRQKIDMLEPRQSVDTGGAAGSNQNAIYATSDPKVAIAMGLTTLGSDTGMFPNDPQMVLFKGNIRKGENVYLHKVSFNGPDGKPQFVQGGNSREFHTIPGVKGIKPVEIKAVPVDKYLNLIRTATPQDLELQKKYMQQGVAEGSENNNITAQKIFFARSDKTPKGWSYDHVGFITQDGRQIQMSGHKGNDVYVTNDVTDDPEFPEQNIKIVSLSKPVSVPTTNSVGAENCGTFVANVLQANGIKGIDTKKIYSVFKQPQKQAVAEGSEQSLASMVSQDQSERNEFEKFVKSQAGDDWTKGAKMYAQLKKRPSNDIFGDASRQNQFMKMKFDFDKFTDVDWHNYWLMAQHCDHNRDFQKNALSIIKKYLGTDHENYKYLYDRISCGATGNQKYGTQLICDKDKQGVAEAVAPDQKLQSSVLYHGTPTKAGYQGISSQGLKIDPELIAQKYKGQENFAPLPGVYMTKEFGNAVRYSFMSNVPDEQYANYIKQEPNGYVFEFSGKDLTTVTPDEDELGSLLRQLINTKNLQPNLLKIVQAVPEELRAKLQQPNVDFETIAIAGKWLVNKISDSTIQYLMKRYHNVVNYGGIKPSAVWVIPKPNERFLRDRQGTFNTHNGYVNYAKRFGKKYDLTEEKKSIAEGAEQPDLISAFRDFLPIAMRELDIDKLPPIRLLKQVPAGDQPTFGKFNNQENVIHLGIAERHPVDILRTLAHELVHYKQNTEHQLAAGSGKTGSPEENQAHEVAGVVMRDFNRLHPEYFAASAVELTEDRSDYEIRNRAKLDDILVNLCRHVVEGQRVDPSKYGMVAACVVDPDNRQVIGVNELTADGTRKHGERVAMERYQAQYGDIPKGSIIVTTCSPCNEEHMTERYGESCTDIINNSNCRKVYCGYQDPSQTDEHNEFTMEVTGNADIVGLCEHFAATFLNENFADGKGPGRPGDSVRHGIPKNATMAELEKASRAKGRKGQLARWQLNMRRGRKK